MALLLQRRQTPSLSEVMSLETAGDRVRYDEIVFFALC